MVACFAGNIVDGYKSSYPVTGGYKLGAHFTIKHKLGMRRFSYDYFLPKVSSKLLVVLVERG